VKGYGFGMVAIVLLLITILIPALVAVHETRRTKKKTQPKKDRGWANAKIFLTVVCMTASVVIAILKEIKEHGLRKNEQRLRIENEAWKTNTTEQLFKIGVLQNNADAASHYSNILKAASIRYNAETTPIDKFLASRDSRKAVRDEAEAINRQVLAKHVVRVQPVYEFVVSRFDSWIAGLKSKGINVTTQTNSDALLHLEGERRPNGTPRRATFDGGEIRIDLVAGTIAEGKLSFRFAMQMSATTPLILSDVVWEVVVNENSYEVTRKKHGPIQRYEGTLESPMADEKFVAALKESFDEVFAWAADDAVAQRKKL
jgi:hypothetical protein